MATADSEWLQWEWREHYRIWEAGRRVLLFPENYLDPTLRDDRSIFFKEFESELMQQEVTDVTAEAAFASHLEKLNEVAHLEVVAMHQEEEPEGPAQETPENGVLKPALHVVARTPGEAPRYFYRKRTPWGTWTAADRGRSPGDRALARTASSLLADVSTRTGGDKRDPNAHRG